MKRIYKIVAAVYKAYSYRKVDIPYFRTISTIVFLLFIHLAQVGLLFKISSQYMLPFNSGNKTILWLEAALYFVVFFVVFSILFPERKLQEQDIKEALVLKVKKILPWYFVATILLLMILLVRHGVQRGAIHF
jgi:hypothetical protein